MPIKRVKKGRHEKLRRLITSVSDAVKVLHLRQQSNDHPVADDSSVEFHSQRRWAM